MRPKGAPALYINGHVAATASVTMPEGIGCNGVMGIDGDVLGDVDIGGITSPGCVFGFRMGTTLTALTGNPCLNLQNAKLVLFATPCCRENRVMLYIGGNVERGASLAIQQFFYSKADIRGQLDGLLVVQGIVSSTVYIGAVGEEGNITVMQQGIESLPERHTWPVACCLIDTRGKIHLGVSGTHRLTAVCDTF